MYIPKTSSIRTHLLFFANFVLTELHQLESAIVGDARESHLDIECYGTFVQRAGKPIVDWGS